MMHPKNMSKTLEDIKLLLKKQKDLQAQTNDKKAKAAMSHRDRNDGWMVINDRYQYWLVIFSLP